MIDCDICYVVAMKKIKDPTGRDLGDKSYYTYMGPEVGEYCHFGNFDKAFKFKTQDLARKRITNYQNHIANNLNHFDVSTLCIATVSVEFNSIEQINLTLSEV